MLGKITFLSIVSLGLITFVLVFLSVEVLPPSPASAPAAVLAIPEALTTDTWAIFDPQTGRILDGDNTEKILPIASITKLFTATAVEMSTEKNNGFYILSEDVNVEGRMGKLTIGDRVTPYELLFPLLIESSNDAAEAIKRSLGEEYVKNTGQVLELLGLASTTLVDASGLSEKNTSTVTDLALLFSYIKKMHPHIFDITQLNMYIDAKTGYINNNPGRTFPTFTGGKHGFTDAAKRTFIGTFSTGNSDEEIGIILLGSDSLPLDIKALNTYGMSLKRTSGIMTP